MILEKFPIQGFTKVQNLIYYDGTFVSLFKDNQNSLYIMSWCDTTLTHNTWTISQVTKEQLIEYQNKKITLRDLVLNPNNNCLIVDIDDELTYSNIREDIPEEYIPSKESFYNSQINSPILLDTII